MAKKREQTKLSKILNKSKDKSYVTQQIFQNLTPGELRVSVESLKNHYLFKRQISLSKDSSIDSIYDQPFVTATLEKNISWCIGIVNHHAVVLNNFQVLENNLTELLLSNNYRDALQVLSEIDSLCGVSTWSITLRCSILRLIDDHLSLTNYLTELYKDCNSNSFLKTIIYYLGGRYTADGTMFLTNVNSLFRTFSAIEDEEVYNEPRYSDTLLMKIQWTGPS